MRRNGMVVERLTVFEDAPISKQVSASVRAKHEDQGPLLSGTALFSTCISWFLISSRLTLEIKVCLQYIYTVNFFVFFTPENTVICATGYFEVMIYSFFRVKRIESSKSKKLKKKFFQVIICYFIISYDTYNVILIISIYNYLSKHGLNKTCPILKWTKCYIKKNFIFFINIILIALIHYYKFYYI